VALDSTPAEPADETAPDAGLSEGGRVRNRLLIALVLAVGLLAVAGASGVGAEVGQSLAHAFSGTPDGCGEPGG
jgi:hypothetical protein